MIQYFRSVSGQSARLQSFLVVILAVALIQITVVLAFMAHSVYATPTVISGKKITAIAYGNDPSHAVALADDGTFYSWGQNGSGQLGDGTHVASSTPRAIDPAGTPLSSKTVTAVSTGSAFTLALASDGSVYSWGINADGQLGNGSNMASNRPGAVMTAGTPMAGKTITAIAGGYDHSLALASDGSLYAWGYNYYGQLGNGTNTDSNVPVAVTTAGTPLAGKTVVAISAGDQFSLALASDGTVYAWGYNDDGELGNGATADSNLPVLVTSVGTPMAGKTITVVSAGDQYSLARASDGTVYSWGRNQYGQLGDGTNGSSSTPVAVVTAGTPMARKSIMAISAGYAHALALASDGTVYSWGDNGNGELGNGTNVGSSIPVGVTTAGTPMAGKVVIAVSAGDQHSLALASDGSVFGWGWNQFGQLGDSSTNTDSALAVQAIEPGVAPPSYPEQLQATAAKSSVTLNWLPPASNGGSVVTEYVLQYKSVSASTWTTVTGITGNSFTVNGLGEGVVYNFRVAAINSAGASVYTLAVTIAVPSSADSVPLAPDTGATPAQTGMAVGMLISVVLGVLVGVHRLTKQRI